MSYTISHIGATLAENYVFMVIQQLFWNRSMHRNMHSNFVFPNIMHAPGKRITSIQELQQVDELAIEPPPQACAQAVDVPRHDAHAGWHMLGCLSLDKLGLRHLPMLFTPLVTLFLVALAHAEAGLHPVCKPRPASSDVLFQVVLFSWSAHSVGLIRVKHGEVGPPPHCQGGLCLYAQLPLLLQLSVLPHHSGQLPA